MLCSTNASYSDWASEFAHCKSSKENGCAGEPAYLTLSAQPVPLVKQPRVIPSIHLPEYSDFGVMQPQASEVLLPFANPSSSETCDSLAVTFLKPLVHSPGVFRRRRGHSTASCRSVQFDARDP
jgi:hypothetical protein